MSEQEPVAADEEAENTAEEKAAEEETSSGDAGLPDADDVPQEDIDEIEEERQERLDPENRPDNAEIDNTDREFDSDAGMFTDNPDYNESQKPFAGGDE